MKDLYVVIPCRQACDAELAISAYIRLTYFPAENHAELYNGYFDGSAPLVHCRPTDFCTAIERSTIVFDVDVDLTGAGSRAAHDFPATHFHICPKIVACGEPLVRTRATHQVMRFFRVPGRRSEEHTSELQSHLNL